MFSAFLCNKRFFTVCKCNVKAQPGCPGKVEQERYYVPHIERSCLLVGLRKQSITGCTRSVRGLSVTLATTKVVTGKSHPDQRPTDQEIQVKVMGEKRTIADDPRRHLIGHRPHCRRRKEGSERTGGIGRPWTSYAYRLHCPLRATRACSCHNSFPSPTNKSGGGQSTKNQK